MVIIGVIAFYLMMWSHIQLIFDRQVKFHRMLRKVSAGVLGAVLLISFLSRL